MRVVKDADSIRTNPQSGSFYGYLPAKYGHLIHKRGMRFERGGVISVFNRDTCDFKIRKPDR